MTAEEMAARIKELERELVRLQGLTNTARAESKRLGRDVLREEADAALSAFSGEWEYLREIAERWGGGSAARLASRARDLLKRGLVEQRWNPGVMTICQWRLAPTKEHR